MIGFVWGVLRPVLGVVFGRNFLPVWLIGGVIAAGWTYGFAQRQIGRAEGRAQEKIRQVEARNEVIKRAAAARRRAFSRDHRNKRPYPGVRFD